MEQQTDVSLMSILKKRITRRTRLVGTALSQVRQRGAWLMSCFSFQVGFTSAPGQGGILAQREFDRRFSPHFVSGTVLSGMRPPWVLGPLSLLRRFV